MLLSILSLLILGKIIKASDFTLENALNTIQATLPSKSVNTDDHPTCTLSNTESCALSSLKHDITNLVYPGGSSRCIFSTSTPYSIQVIPGDRDKLLFYFQDGGACWDRISTMPRPLCRIDAEPYDMVGIFDRANPDNRFRNYTVVVALYCSGDIFGGSVVRPYRDSAGHWVNQTGIQNAQATLDWVYQQQQAGELTNSLSELVVMGSSAGSIGVQLWANEVINTLSYDKVAVVPDSFVGFFPPGTEGPLVKEYGFCRSHILPINLKPSCEEGQFEFSVLMTQFMRMNPNIPFAYLQSKEDEVQFAYYIAIGLTSHVSAELTPHQFYGNVSDILAGYSINNRNMVTFLVDGTQHTFTPNEHYYTADPRGPERK